ncbi:MAG: ClbS/DfsB family four-helix bundle protein [bacterium]|nr:ClbS/DfsB family four-helix bundle protein [bacterium]
MEERLSRGEILRRLETEYLKLHSALDNLSAVQMEQGGVVGTWSVKDVLAHMIYWNRFPIEEIGHALRGEPFPNKDWEDDEINAQVVAQYQANTADDVRAEFNTSFMEVVEYIRRLPDSAFQPGNEIEQQTGETIHGIFANNTYDHYALHLEQIQEWMRQTR